MNPDDTQSSNPISSLGQDAFLPLVLISLSLMLFFLWQIKNFSQQRASYSAAIERQQEPLKQAKQAQASVDRIGLDLLDLAKNGDADAKAIITKYNISQQPVTAPSAK